MRRFYARVVCVATPTFARLGKHVGEERGWNEKIHALYGLHAINTDCAKWETFLRD